MYLYSTYVSLKHASDKECILSSLQEFNALNLHIFTCIRTGTPTLPVAFRELLPVAASWKNIGTLLGIATHVLDNIQCNGGRVEDNLREMLAKWLTQVNPIPTWANLANAVEPFHERIAHHIRELDNS